MRYRTFGRMGWQVSEIGYGMWAMGKQWSGSEDDSSLAALHRAVEQGCNFYDTAWAYGAGHSEALLGQLVRAHPDKTLYTASKIPAMNFKWPALGSYTPAETYPYQHIIDYTDWSLRNLGLDHVDLMQLHVWHDNWTDDEDWQRAVQDLKQAGKIRAFGISVNRWEPDNVIKAINTGLIDAVQVIYNIFDQNPEDNLFPACRAHNVAVIARVPFDEGSLTGTLTKESTWPEGDWRNSYFVPENLHATLDRVEKLRPLVPPGMSMAQMALRFILANPDVSTIIPGMRKLSNVDTNVGVSDGQALPEPLLAELRPHRWVRQRTTWSQ